jgi:hypothetical protein
MLARQQIEWNALSESADENVYFPLIRPAQVTQQALTALGIAAKVQPMLENKIAKCAARLVLHHLKIVVN